MHRMQLGGWPSSHGRYVESPLTTMSIYGKTNIVPPLFSGISHEFHNCKQLASSQGSFGSSLILSFQCTCNVIPTDLLTFMRRKHHQASGYNAAHTTEIVSLHYSYTVCSCKMRNGWMLGTGGGQRWTSSVSLDGNCQPTPFRYYNSDLWATEASSVWGSVRLIARWTPEQRLISVFISKDV